MPDSATTDRTKQSTPNEDRGDHRGQGPILTPGLLEVMNRDSSDSGYVASAEKLVADAVKARATDIHLDPRDDSVLVRFRIDGVLYDAVDIPKSGGLHIVRHLQVMAGIDAATRPDVYDGHTSFETPTREVNLRVASIPSVQGDKLSIRILDPGRAPFELEALGLAADDVDEIRNWIDQPEGMLLVTGPTGSGKTTTLYTLLNELATQNRNIISLEDPVELTLDSITQVQIEPRATPNSVSYASGLTRLLRHDPDIIAVGEIRSDETADTAVDIALSGHTLLSSLNARDAAGTVSLLRNLGIKDHQIVAALRVVISQRTFRLLCDSCKKERPPTRAECESLAEQSLQAPERAFEAAGCEKCLETGYRGLTAAFEVWNIDEAGRNLVLDQADETRLRAHLRERNVHSIRQNALAKAAGGLVALRDVAWLP